ncbi:MAG: SDR family oxidoreductase, partial [Alicyclobacillus sp.]|nr:SDR family oxidoreductase [Alicyclobacillus sp.]
MAYTIDLSGRVAAITGGGTGLGRQTAIRLAEAGAKVVIASNDLASAQRTERDIVAKGGAAWAVETDVSDEQSVAAMVGRVEDAWGGVDILINNAAIYPSRPFDEVTTEEWDSVFRVNARGYFLCARAVVPGMKRRAWGRIVNISSITYFLGFPNLIHYVSTKGAAVGFTRALAREVGEFGITVNAIAPGAFPTAAEEIHPDREAYNRRILDSQCLKRRGTPDDIAGTVLFFCSELSSFITGQT